MYKLGKRQRIQKENVDTRPFEDVVGYRNALQTERNETKGKVFMLKDCMPNVPELLSTYFEYTSNILINLLAHKTNSLLS